MDGVRFYSEITILHKFTLLPPDLRQIYTLV